jgi:antitoxin component YwqK of YwqJK toxin-antitoxin module
MSSDTFYLGKQVGLKQGWKPDGFLSVYRPYRNGHPIDTHKLWYDNKKRQSVGVYDTAGNRNGWCIKWYENGTIEDSVLWAHGNKLEEFNYYASGKPMAHNVMKYDSAPEGLIVTSVTWDRTGKKNGDVKNGNGIAIFPQHTTGPDTLYYDTLHIKNGRVVDADYYWGRKP